MVPKVVPVWKEVGQSTHAIAQSLSRQYNVPTAHTGILDPMAEGVVVILLGEERFLKDYYVRGEKSYTVEVLVGAATDTQDLLGIVTRFGSFNFSLAAFDVVLSQFKGEIMQAPPVFSAIKYDGKRLFQHVRDQTIDSVSIRERPVTVLSTVTLGKEEVSNIELKSRLDSTLFRVSGDFRQEIIKERWEAVMPDLPEKMPLFRINVRSGPGFYVRALVRDLGRRLNVPLVVYSLVREENAGFVREDCICID